MRIYWASSLFIYVRVFYCILFTYKLYLRIITVQLMYSRPGHKFWLDLVHQIDELRGDNPHGPVAGPLTLMRVLWKTWDKYPRDFVIYPSMYFNPFSWDVLDASSPCRSLNKMDEALLKRCVEYYRSNNRSYVLEFHTETWRRGRVK